MSDFFGEVIGGQIGQFPQFVEGPLVRSLAAYQLYYARWSKVWEAQALLRARFVAGDDDSATQRSAAMRTVLAQFAAGIRTGEEAQCLERLVRSAAPRPVWNRKIVEQSTGHVAVLRGAFWPGLYWSATA